MHVQVLLAIQGQQDPGINKFLSAVEAASFVGVVATSVRSLCAGIGKHLRPHKRPQSKPALKPVRLDCLEHVGHGWDT